MFLKPGEACSSLWTGVFMGDKSRKLILGQISDCLTSWVTVSSSSNSNLLNAYYSLETILNTCFRDLNLTINIWIKYDNYPHFTDWAIKSKQK